MTKYFLIGCLIAVASAVTDNDDGTSGNAPCINPYLAVCGECNSSIGEDPHTTHGCEADDGGLVAVGSTLENRSWYQRGSKYDALIIKTKGGCSYAENNYYLNGAGEGCDTWDWVTKLAVDNGDNEFALGVAKSLDGTFFIVVGMLEEDGKAKIFMSKINADDGAIVWTKKVNSNDASLNASAETVAFTSDGGFLVGGGVDSIIPAGEMRFKSGGQVEESKAWICKVSASQAAGDEEPEIEWAWTNSDGRQGNAKAIRVDSSDNIFTVAGAASTTLYKLNSSGVVQWDTGSDYNDMQLNDLSVNSDGTMAMVGHQQVSSQWMGLLVGTDSSGAQSWTQNYGNYAGGTGNYDGYTAGGDWIYNECWGIAKSYTDGTSTQDGYVLACGTGIECENGDDNVSECSTDWRSNWRAMSIQTDLSGDRVWSRMDNFYNDGDDTAASASEFVFELSSGGHVAITDEAMGFGFITIEQYDNVACTAAQTLGGESNWSTTVAFSAATFGLISANLF